ncbi:TetR/AcrR family transcriptional regulator [Sutcliffiella halmapala]|uniref:TetR/AcrR family transcriptional regulator n=1 Tax=Sutcliffiella halmapala TaxID=79882 RepID=UPI00099582E6|nr:TetR/AcrR family transcriptional regulator [Sutcliffiella halmapala]
MCPLNEDQLEQIRIERKNQIMAAALKVFAENGIKLTKISMIAKEAGISHGLLYHYFKSKEEVLHSSLEWAMTNGTAELFQNMNSMNASPLEKIKYLSKVAVTEGDSNIFRVVQHLTHSGLDIPEETQKLVESSGNEYVQNLLPLIIQGQENGEIIPSPPQELLELYLTVISGIMMEGDLKWWQENMDKKIDLLLRMITVR